MDFRPPIKKKKFPSKIYEQQIPFPLVNNQKFQGIFTGLSVDVFDPKEMIQIYDNGFYGKGSQSKGAPIVVQKNLKEEVNSEDIQESLVLDLEETIFLSHFLQVLEVRDLKNIVLSSTSLYLECCKIKPNYIQYLVGYIYLKSMNWVVKTGMKYGGDFLIYKKGPRFHHASMIVLINRLDEISKEHIQCLHRIAENTKKEVLFLTVNYPLNFELLEPSQHLSVIDQFTVSETILKRLNLSEFIQKKRI